MEEKDNRHKKIMKRFLIAGEGRIDKISKQSTYDIILANINLNVIIEDLKSYYKILSPGGVLILSGFLINDLDKILECTKSLNLKLIEKNFRNKWLSLIVKKTSN